MEKQDAQQLAGEHFILTPSAEPSESLVLCAQHCPVYLYLYLLPV